MEIPYLNPRVGISIPNLRPPGRGSGMYIPICERREGMEIPYLTLRVGISIPNQRLPGRGSGMEIPTRGVR